MIDRFLDKNGLVKIWPKKHADKIIVLEYLITKFDIGKTYSEKMINEVLNNWHTFHDWPLLRRELVDRGYLLRDKAGYEYWVVSKK